MPPTPSSSLLGALSVSYPLHCFLHIPSNTRVSVPPPKTLLIASSSRPSSPLSASHFPSRFSDARDDTELDTPPLLPYSKPLLSMPASTLGANPVKPPTGRVPGGAMSTKSLPVRRAGGPIKKPGMNGAVKSAGGAVNGVAPHLSPYEIMAGRIANRVAEMAESYTLVER